MDSTSTIGLYIKAIGTCVVTGLTAYATALNDGSVTATEWLTIAIAVVVSTAVVWAVPSTPEAYRKYGKTIAAAVVALLSSLVVGLTDGGDGVIGHLTQPEVVTAIVAMLIAAGLIGSASNAASSDPVDARGKIVPISMSEKAGLSPNAQGL